LVETKYPVTHTPYRAERLEIALWAILAKEPDYRARPDK
jgi:hypothetical protein